MKFSPKAPNKNITKNNDEIVADVRTRLPRTATKTKKNYKDLSTSESESESEKEVSYLFKDKLPTKVNKHNYDLCLFFLNYFMFLCMLIILTACPLLV